VPELVVEAPAPVPVVEPVQPVADEPEDEVLEVKSVETVSAIDLVMGEDEDGEHDAPPASPY
jgi:hypothetical protein